MRSLAAMLAFAGAFLFGIVSSDAALVVNIDKTNQRMTVQVDGATAHSWAISTGRSGYNTPNGSFRPQRLARKWNSRKYQWAPMPHSVFFHGGYAIHGSYETGRLGRPASHGCIRLHPANAAKLFALVQQHGMDDTRIVVTGHIPRPVYAGVRAKARRTAEDQRYVPMTRPAYRYYYAPSQFDFPGPWYRQM
jgi:lipoprotein-anchoring transpeptidase ErfK/SrfK